MTNDHLDDEAISAYLDGEATSDEAAHLDRCDACGARLGALRAAASAIGAPVPSIDPAQRDRAIEEALRAADTAPSNVTPLRARHSPAVRWLPAAAAIVAVLALVPVLGDLGSSDSDDMTAAGGGDATEEQEQFAADDGAGSAAMQAPGSVTVDAGDVGAVAAGDVRGLVEGALDLSATSEQRAAAEEDAAAPAAGGAGGGGGGEAAPEASSTEAVPAPCEERARTDFDDLAALRYRAVGTIDGTDVSILAFDLVADEPRLRVLALSLDNCEITLAQEIASGR